MRIWSFVLLSLIGITPASAADDAFLKAVNFALTGSDDARATLSTENKCDVLIGGQTFHLNNIDVTRLTIGRVEQKTAFGAIVSVAIDMHGEKSVYETIRPPLQYSADDEFSRAVKQQDPSVFARSSPSEMGSARVNREGLTGGRANHNASREGRGVVPGMG